MSINKRSTALVGLVLSLLLLPASASAAALFNLVVKESGMHRISYADLLAQGADLQGVKHRKLALMLGTQSIPLRTAGMLDENGKRTNIFGPGAYLEFYAEVEESLYTDKTAYTLHLSRPLRTSFGAQRAARFRKAAPASTSYRATQLVEQNNYYDFLSPSTIDPWHYGQQIGVGGATGPELAFNLDNVVPGPVTLEAQVFGLLDLPEAGNDHHVSFVVNGSPAGDQQFDGNRAITVSLPTGDQTLSVSEGQNTLRMDLLGIAGMPLDAVALNEFEVTYQRTTQANNNYLDGGFAAGQSLISGFSNADINVYRFDNAGTPHRLKRIYRTQPNSEQETHSIGVNLAEYGARLIVVAEGGYRTPEVAVIADEQDITSGKTDYLVITHPAFLGTTLDSFVQMREQTSDLSVKVVDINQVYGQFGNHLPSSAAIHQYVKFAAANMGVRYVLLVGGDQYDYKNYQSEAISHIPTAYAATPGGELIVQQNPVDSLYGDLDGDGVPDVPVGRLPVRNQQELAYIVEKINDYTARSGYAASAMVATDIDDNSNSILFEPQGESFISLLPPAWQTDVVRAYPQSQGGETAKSNLFAAINNGVSLASYLGHSAEQVWSRATPPLLTASEVSQFNNIDKPAVVTQWGCWNTYFIKPSSNSMAQALMLGGYTGAATVLGASSLTELASEQVLSKLFIPRLLTPGTTVGDAVIAAKQEMAKSMPRASDVLLGWQILGDPALVVNP
ncbi:MAG: C25 family cysteine peptidase [Pseudomonadota bacterium]